VLQAIASGRQLTISGAAAVSNTSSNIMVEGGYGSFTVSDNNQLHTEVSIQGSTSGVRRLDLSGVTGAGAYVSWAADYDRAVSGSARADTISFYHYGNNTASGGRGDDLIFGALGNDTLSGQQGADRLDGREGNDFLTGGRGNDTIDGGEGSDTLVFYGARADYEISIVNGSYVISHTGGTGRDGTDTFANVEFLKFSDQIVAIEDIFV